MIIISGASRGIGKYLLGKFIEENKDVIGLYNNTKPEGNIDNYYKLDITNEDEVDKFVSSYTDRLNNITLINCAGSNYNSMAHKFDLNERKKVYETNTNGTFILMKSLLPTMRQEQFGRIINFSSVVPQIGTMGTSAYAGSKSALWGLTKVIANENAQKGITANCLNLGYFDIGMIAEVPEEVLNSIVTQITAKKLGDPVNIYNAVTFLINSDYITGTSLDINGGLY